MKNPLRTAAALALGSALAAWIFGLPGARADSPGFGALSNLATPRGGKVLHFSSADPSGGNADFRPIAPGRTLTLLDYKGAGIVRRWWVTVAPRDDRQIQREAIVRCYWDGEKDPSVEAPLSDFFGVGFGEWHDFHSAAVNMTSGGYDCYWPMPFHKSARITIENRASIPINALYYNIDVETHHRIPKDMLYFHAQFRRSDPTTPGQPYTILQTTGRGQYVGTVLSMQSLRANSLSFLEGDEQVTVDGESAPSILGTGTEDYFSSGWYFDTGVYSSDYHGLTIKDPAGRISAYRWHIEDAIPFEKSLVFNIEHGTNNTVTADYSSVAFYYQTHPHPPFPPLPSNLLPEPPHQPLRVPDMIEGESLASSATATEGDRSVQNMGGFDGDWSGNAQLFWQPAHPGAQLTLTVNAPEAKDYELIGYFTQAADYGDLTFAVNGQDLPTVVHGYHDGVIATGPISLGHAALRAGANTLTVTIAGKDPLSANYFAGIDGFELK